MSEPFFSLHIPSENGLVNMKICLANSLSIAFTELYIEITKPKLGDSNI